MQGMGQNVGRCLTPRHQFAVLPNKTVAIGHGHILELRNKETAAQRRIKHRERIFIPARMQSESGEF
jgi:hypothetical protein